MLIQAMLDAPMFITRWRWVAGVSLALPRFRGGRKVPPQLARMHAEDLIGSVFPDQIACAENLAGEREVPDHPLVNQTIADCLTEAMDIEGLQRLLAGIESGAVRVIARDLTEPSPLALEVLSARPYAFLDDAPLEERRTQAVMARRWLDPETAADLGRLDPEAIARVRAEAWPEATNRRRAARCAGLARLSHCGRRSHRGRAGRWLSELASAEACRASACAGRHGSGSPPSDCRCSGRSGRTARLEPASPRPRAMPSAHGRARRRWSRSCAAGWRAKGPSPRTRSRRSLGLEAGAIAAALAALEAEGFAMRGRFAGGEARNGASAGCSPASTPTPSSACARKSSRSPRATSCASCSPGSASVTMRAWKGPRRLDEVVGQLEGFGAAAGAWEREILPARLAGYEPAWLDDRCLAGRVTWSRLGPRNGRANGEQRRATPVRTTPITLLARSNAPLWSSLNPRPDAIPPTPRAQQVLEFLRDHGASFFDDMAAGSGLLRAQIEEALAELVALGLVTSDSFAGLRALLVPSDRRPSPLSVRRRRRATSSGMDGAGRWALVRRTASMQPVAGDDSSALEHLARTLLHRYGVVFWRLLEREAGWLPPWRDLLRVYRKLERRGEIRGGRFVAGFSGEQFALPEAIGALREVRRKPANDALVSLSGADPLNLAGILTPGMKLPALTGNRVLYRNGMPVALLAAGEVQFLETLEPATEWQARVALLRSAMPTEIARQVS